jgi:hypothetical protein
MGTTNDVGAHISCRYQRQGTKVIDAQTEKCSIFDLYVSYFRYWLK